MTDTARQPISRRTVAKGAAWTAPVILGGVAAPAYAASGNKPTIIPGPSCKQPGNSCNPIVKGYVFTYTINNPSSKLIYLYAPPSLSTGGVLPLTYAGAVVNGTFYGPSTPVPVPAGASVQLLVTTGSSNSADLVFDFTITFAWGHTLDPADDTEHIGDDVTATVTVDGTPPCVNCAPPPPGTPAATESSTEEAARTAEESTSETSTESEPASTTTSTPAPSAESEPPPTSTETTTP